MTALVNRRQLKAGNKKNVCAGGRRSRSVRSHSAALAVTRALFSPSG